MVRDYYLFLSKVRKEFMFKSSEIMYMTQVVRVYHDDESDIKASEVYTAKFEINRGTPGYKCLVGIIFLNGHN